jgi:hypothetical protein
MTAFAALNRSNCDGNPFVHGTQRPTSRRLKATGSSSGGKLEDVPMENMTYDDRRQQGTDDTGRSR